MSCMTEVSSLYSSQRKIEKVVYVSGGAGMQHHYIAGFGCSNIWIIGYLDMKIPFELFLMSKPY